MRALFCESVVMHLSPWWGGNRAKFWALRFAGATVEWPLWIDSNVWIRDMKNFSSGRGTVISRGAVLNCSTSLTLGAGCLIGYYSFISTAMHNVPGALDEDIATAGHTHKPVRLGEDYWVGAHACVLPGVTLGRGAVVGAGAVVTHDLGEGQIAVGDAARILRQRG